MIEQQAKVVPFYDWNGKYLGTVRLQKAIEAAEAGDMTLRMKGRGRKSRITAAHQVYKRNARPSACTMTMRDVENNAFGQAFSALGPTDSIRALDRAIDKVQAWPEVHDTKAVCISAGRVIQPQLAQGNCNA